MSTEKRILCPACQRGVRESNLATHEQSRPHRRAAEITALLDKHSMSYAVIAKQVGVSREYVRSFAKKRSYEYPAEVERAVPTGYESNPLEFFRKIGSLGGAQRTKRKIKAARHNLKIANRVRGQLEKGVPDPFPA